MRMVCLGLKYYKHILSTCKKFLNKKNLIAFEIGDKQGKELKALAQDILNYAVSKGFQYPKNRKHFNNVFGRQDYFDGEYEYDAILEFDYDADRTKEFGVIELIISTILLM